MQCVACKVDNDRVVDSRSCESGGAIRRRRKCLACGRRFTTYERAETTVRTVIKKDGRREPFNREKILGGLRTACQKRQISTDQLGRIADRIEQEVFGESDREVNTRTIGERVIEELKALDKVAYVRFASVYREFTDILEFAAFLMPFLPPESRARLCDVPPRHGTFPPRRTVPLSPPGEGSQGDARGGVPPERAFEQARGVVVPPAPRRGADGRIVAPLPRLDGRIASVHAPSEPHHRAPLPVGLVKKDRRNGNHPGGT